MTGESEKCQNTGIRVWLYLPWSTPCRLERGGKSQNVLKGVLKFSKPEEGNQRCRKLTDSCLKSCVQVLFMILSH